MRNVLCFGDSNTFGFDPAAAAAGTGMRYPFEQRWPGVLQGLLGEGWHVIEEGLCGRTTVHTDPYEPYRCGAAALPYALESHQPLDAVVIALGTNDFKTRYGLPAADIARGFESLAGIVKMYPWGPGSRVPHIVIVAPPHLGEGVEQVVLSSFDERSVAVSHEAGRWCRVIAEEQGCGFVDAALVCEPSEIDHIHLTPEGHASLAAAIARELAVAFPGC